MSQPSRHHPLYAELADWFPLLTPPEDYAPEAAFYAETLVAACDPPLRRVLELGSGGGHTASHLKGQFELVLVDIAAAMLDVSRRLNPECEHRLGDMLTIRLERTFDAVFVQDAASHLVSPADLQAAFATAWVHCRPGGAVLFAPDHVRESFRPGTLHGGVDGADGRALRYLEWVWDPDPADDTYQYDLALLLREADGTVRVEQDQLVCGMLPRAAWLDGLAAAGFEPQAVPYPSGIAEGYVTEVFVGRRPG